MWPLKNVENTSSTKIESGMAPITVKESDDARASKQASSIDRTVTLSGSQTKISELDLVNRFIQFLISAKILKPIFSSNSNGLRGPDWGIFP